MILRTKAWILQADALLCRKADRTTYIRAIDWMSRARTKRRTSIVRRRASRARCRLWRVYYESTIQISPKMSQNFLKLFSSLKSEQPHGKVLTTTILTWRTMMLFRTFLYQWRTFCMRKKTCTLEIAYLVILYHSRNCRPLTILWMAMALVCMMIARFPSSSSNTPALKYILVWPTWYLGKWGFVVKQKKKKEKKKKRNISQGVTVRNI